MPGDDTATWSEGELDALKAELGSSYAGRTCLVTGADGFMGSHLTEALVHLDADVIAFVRATSSGALNNIGHLRRRLRVVFADLTDKTSIDYLMRDLAQAPDKPYVFHLGAQAHVGESWHRPYETVMANTIGTLNLLQSVVDHGVELEKFDTAGTSEEYGNVHESVRDQHDFDELGGLILHERSPINPKSIYATAKVAADFLTMNYHDAYGVPGVVTRMFNNYGPRQNPRYVTGTIITQALSRPEIELGALEPLRDFCFTTDGVRGHLTVAAHGVPGDLYVYGQGKNISMADWTDLILRTGARARLLAGRPPRRHDREASAPGRHGRDGAAGRLREAQPRDRLGAEGVVGGRRPADDPLVRRASRALARPRRLARQASRADHVSAIVDGRVTMVDGIAFADTAAASPYREQWEQEAADDHVRSAIANAPAGAAADELLTGKIAPLWDRFPAGRHVGTLLDLGAGYGRIDLHLARTKGLTCDTFYALDISETMCGG